MLISIPQVIEFLNGLLEKETIVDLDANKVIILADNYNLDKTRNV